MRVPTVVLVLVTACLTAPASAQDAPEAALSWEAPPGCPGRAEVAAEVARLLDGTPPMAARGRVVRDGDRVRLRLELGDEADASVRELEAASCRELARAGALVIAIATRPEAFVGAGSETEAGAGSETGSESESEAESETGSGSETESGSETGSGSASESVTESGSETESGSASESVTESESGSGPDAAAVGPARSAPVTESAAIGDEPASGEIARGARLRFVGAVRAVLSIGPLPSASPGIAVDVGVGIGAFEVTVGGVALAEQEAALEDGSAGGVFGLALARLRACAVAEVEWVELLPCAGLEAGGAWGRGEGVPVTRQGAAPWAAATVGFDARVRLVPFLALGVSAELEIPLLRSPFILMVEGERRVVHRAFEVGAVLGVGATVIFE